VVNKKHQETCSGKHYADGTCFPRSGPIFPEDYAAELKQIEANRKAGGFDMKGPSPKKVK
jgi:hypothetical protein